MKNINLLVIFTLILYALSESMQAQVNNGLVAKYSFFGNANDEVGSNNGVVSGATLVADRFGVPNRAYKFDGFSGHSINLGSSTTLKPTSCTISLWAYIDSTACYQTALNYQPFIVTTNSNAPNPYYEAYAMGYWLPQPQMLTVNYQGGASSGTPCFSTANIQTKRWYHYVFSFDNDSMVTYLDNVRICALPKSFTTTYSTDDVMLGKTTVPSKDAYLNGRLDDIRIYNRRLTPKEVDTLYNLPSVNPNSVADVDQDSETTILYQHGMLTIQSAQAIKEVRILDLAGCTMQRFVSSADNTYSLRSYSTGIYLCEVQLKNGQRRIQKIILD